LLSHEQCVELRRRLFHGRWWFVRLRRHQESTAKWRAKLREIGRRLSRFQPHADY
jgi:hypothetical protein